MSERSSSESRQAVVERLSAAKRLLLLTHARPDGDGLGSISALARAAVAAGKEAHVLVPDRRPPKYDFLFEGHEVAGAARFPSLADAAEVIVIVDTCAKAQLDGLVDGLSARREKVLVVDHHATADDIGAVRWIDTSAAAAGVLVTELLERLDWPISLDAAEGLMTAITTDTGWLQFANTDARSLRATARLLEAGLRTDKLYRKLYQTDRPERLALLRRMLGSIELHADERLAVMAIRKADFEATGARSDETENLVNEALRIGSVETAVLLVENDEAVRVSLRSRDAVDVASLAGRFGGGGHRRAAGLRRTEDLDALKARLTVACIEALEGS